jgi:predicted neuraminidase
MKTEVVADQTLGFRNCHAATLLEVGDVLWCAFFAGTREGTPDMSIWLSRRVDGHWTAAVPVTHDLRQAHWNPVLFMQQGQPVLFYKCGTDVQSWHTRLLPLDVDGKPRGPDRVLVGKDFPYGPVKNKCLVLRSGVVLAPGSTELGQHWDAHVDRFDASLGYLGTARVPLVHGTARREQGDTWQGLAEQALWETDTEVVFGWDGIIQPTLWESAPDKVHLLARSTRGCLYRSDSSDAGLSWSEARSAEVPNNNSGVDLVTLSDGSLLLAHNPVADNWGRRTPLSLSRSTNNGLTWAPVMDLETAEGEFSYPAIITLSGGRVAVAWTANRLQIRCRILSGNCLI